MSTLSIAPKEEQIELQGVAESLDQGQLVAVPDQQDRKIELVYTPKKTGAASSLSLFNTRFVEYRRLARRKGSAAVFNLAFVDPRPAHDVYRAPIHWALAALGTVALAIAAYLSLWPVAAGSAALAVVFVVVALRKQLNRWLFFSRHGRIALFELSQPRGDTERLQRLIQLLAKRGQQAWSHLPEGKERLAAEVAEHRRLMCSGVISEERYERAKRRIFSRYKP